MTGKPIDLVVANADSNDLSLLAGNGDGTFDLVASVSVGAGPRWVATGDIDADGIPDLVVANERSHDLSIVAPAEVEL